MAGVMPQYRHRMTLGAIRAEPSCTWRRPFLYIHDHDACHVSQGLILYPVQYVQAARPNKAMIARERGSCTMVRIHKVPIGGACCQRMLDLPRTGRTCSVVSDQPALFTSHMSLAPDDIDAAERNHIVTGCAACLFAVRQMGWGSAKGRPAVENENAEG